MYLSNFFLCIAIISQTEKSTGLTIHQAYIDFSLHNGRQFPQRECWVGVWLGVFFLVFVVVVFWGFVWFFARGLSGFCLFCFCGWTEQIILLISGILRGKSICICTLEFRPPTAKCISPWYQTDEQTYFSMIK